MLTRIDFSGRATTAILLFVCILVPNFVGCVHSPREFLSLVWRGDKQDQQTTPQQPSIGAHNRDQPIRSATTGKVNANIVAKAETADPMDHKVDSAAAPSFNDAPGAGNSGSQSTAWTPRQPVESNLRVEPSHNPVKAVRVENEKSGRMAKVFRRIPDDVLEKNIRSHDPTESAAVVQNHGRAIDHFNSLMKQTKDELQNGKFANFDPERVSEPGAESLNHDPVSEEALQASFNGIDALEQPRQSSNLPEPSDDTEGLRPSLIVNSNEIRGRFSNVGRASESLDVQNTALSKLRRSVQRVPEEEVSFRNRENWPANFPNATPLIVPRMGANAGVELTASISPPIGLPIQQSSHAVLPEEATPAASGRVDNGPLLSLSTMEPANWELQAPPTEDLGENSQATAADRTPASAKQALSDINWEAEPDVTDRGRFMMLRGVAIVVILLIVGGLIIFYRHRWALRSQASSR